MGLVKTIRLAAMQKQLKAKMGITPPMPNGENPKKKGKGYE